MLEKIQVYWILWHLEDTQLSVSCQARIWAGFSIINSDYYAQCFDFKSHPQPQTLACFLRVWKVIVFQCFKQRKNNTFVVYSVLSLWKTHPLLQFQTLTTHGEGKNQQNPWMTHRGSLIWCTDPVCWPEKYIRFTDTWKASTQFLKYSFCYVHCISEEK